MLLADKYAKALVACAREEDLIEQLDIELDMFAAILKKQATLQEIFTSPLVPLQKKKELLDTIFKKGWVSAELKSFLYLLLEARRFNLFGQICQIYRDLIYSLRKRMKVVIESAFVLETEQKKALVKKLSKIYQREVDIVQRHNPELIAGTRIYAGMRLYEGTVKSRLSFLQEHLWKE